MDLWVAIHLWVHGVLECPAVGNDDTKRPLHILNAVEDEAKTMYNERRRRRSTSQANYGCGEKRKN
eukprot:7666172-Prorocentrum_lima.AAC.1